MRLSRRWRFYWLRLGGPAVVLAAGTVVCLAAVFTAQSRWFDQVSAPLSGTDLSRVGSKLTVGPVFPPLHDPVDPLDAHNALIVAADGTALVGERLLQYSTEREAELAIGRALAHDRARNVVGPDGFHDVSFLCPIGCRPAKLGRHDEIVIVLSRISAAGSSDAVRGDRALGAMTQRYAERVGLDRASTKARPWALDELIVAVSVAFLFAPFAIWHAVVARRAPRTPHRHVVDAQSAPPKVVDVCAAAAAARGRGRRLLVAQVAVFAVCGTIAVLDESFALFVLVAPPLSWLIVRRFRVREPRTPSTRVQVDVVRSSQLWLEGLALRVAAIWLTGLAWLIGGAFVYLVPSAVKGEISGPGSDLFGGLPDRQDVAPFVFDLLGLFFILLVFMTGMSAVGRLARRLRVLAVARDQDRRPKPVLLYLRAFDDDPRMLAAGDFGRRAASEVFSFRARTPYEEIIVRELDRHGLVVALAEPGTPRLFLPLGASRKRFPHRDWQEAVQTKMSEAALIVIAVGTTEGLLWELATATRQGLIDRVVLIVPPTDDDEIRARWHMSAEMIAASGGPTLDLPVDPASTLVARVGSAGLQEAVIADRRDEHTYATAIGRTMARCAAPSALGYAGYQEFDAVSGERLSNKSQLVAGVLGILLGGFGAGRFYIGDKRTGVLQVVITLLTCGLGWVWGLVDGILILVKGGYDAHGRKLRDG